MSIRKILNILISFGRLRPGKLNVPTPCFGNTFTRSHMLLLSNLFRNSKGQALKTGSHLSTFQLVNFHMIPIRENMMFV